MRQTHLAGMAALLALAACGEPAQVPGAPTDTAGPAAAASAASLGRFESRNDCIELPGAKRFFLALENAIDARDADALLRITSADVRLDFGGGGGLTTFRERLADDESGLWQALDTATTMGCAHADNGDIVMPWYADQPMEDIDVGRAMIVTGKAVPVRSGPAATASTLTTVTWDTVEVDLADDGSSGSRAVTTRDGTEGYVATDSLRSPLDYRLRAAPVGDGWKIVSFVRGD